GHHLVDIARRVKQLHVLTTRQRRRAALELAPAGRALQHGHEGIVTVRPERMPTRKPVLGELRTTDHHGFARHYAFACGPAARLCQSPTRKTQAPGRWIDLGAWSWSRTLSA